MSRPVDIRVRATRAIMTDKALVLAGTEGVVRSIRPLSVLFEKAYFGPEGQSVVEDNLVVTNLIADHIEAIGVWDEGEGGGES